MKSSSLLAELSKQAASVWYAPTSINIREAAGIHRVGSMYYIVDGALYVKCFTVLELWSTSLRRSARQLEEAQLLLIHWALLYGRSVISRLGQYWPIAPQDNATIVYFGLVTWRLMNQQEPSFFQLHCVLSQSRTSQYLYSEALQLKGTMSYWLLSFITNQMPST